MSSYTIANGKNRKFTAPLQVKIIDLNTEIEKLQEVSLANLHQLDCDVIVIKNFLSLKETNTILTHLLEMPENNLRSLSYSKTYPFSFASLNRSAPDFAEQLKTYYRKAKQFRNSFAHIFEIDMEKKFTRILTALNQNNPAQILETPNEGSYIPFTFRISIPEKNYINLHCDNMFPQLAPEFYELLMRVADVKNQLSFFTVLEQPESGGELSIYNACYDVAKDFNIERQTVILENGMHLDANNDKELFRHKFNLEPGDLVVFAGGQLFHRIEEVYGAKMRITLGGFIGYSKANNNVYYWS